MFVMEYDYVIILILVVIAYFAASRFDAWFRKSKELDKQLTKTYDMSTGETISGYKTGNDALEEYNRRLHEQYMERRDDIRRRALITQEEYERLWIQGRHIMGGAESHIKPPESKPKGYDVKDQFDGVP